jgi:small nuclear ribonucleoprotein (snRNP)-like protein
MISKNIIIALVLTFAFSVGALAQEVNIVLKNDKVIVGRIVEEKADYLILDYELGQLKLDRQNIESITYNPFIMLGEKYGNEAPNSFDNIQQKGMKFVINDPVVVYLRNDKVVSGLLLAKSLDMIMLQTEAGNLTIPKTDLVKIEYISSEYAERGDVVDVFLNNGTRFEGNIYFEDSKNLTLDTEIGRLTLPKTKLRSIEYTGKTGISETTLAEQYSQLSINKRYILPRYDVFELGYSSSFGSDFGSGFGIGYQSRFSLAQFEGMNLSAVGGLGLNYFGLNKDNIITQNPSLAVDLKGGAFITTIGVGAQLNIYPQTSSFYDFYVAPILEAHLVYTSLEQSYPSFPQFNSKETSTEFKFGLGARFGAEFLFDSFKLGIQYNLHTIFGSDGFNQVSVTFIKNIF